MKETATQGGQNQRGKVKQLQLPDENIVVDTLTTNGYHPQSGMTREKGEESRGCSRQSRSGGKRNER